MTNTNPWLFHAEERFSWASGHALHIARRRPDGQIDVVAPFTFTTVSEHEQAPDTPALSRGEAEEFLRAAMNCAWEMGLRPDGYHDTREAMKATSQHLADMRAIAFHKVGAPKP